MKNRKINVDRPQLKANEILQGKNFEAIVRNHQFMSKPFYKQNWFFGTTGLASLGLIIGGTLAFQNSSDENQISIDMLNAEAPPNLAVPDNNLIVLNTKYIHTKDDFSEKTKVINLKNIAPIEKTITLDKSPKLESTDLNIVEEIVKKEEIVSINNTNIIKDSDIEVTTKNKGFGWDINPRISDKIGGTITRNELLDNKGITTEGDISIIHFELHLIDGLGGQVFKEDGNQLNEDMKGALENVGKGETIYFENIRGKVKNGSEVRLNPLRYVLMN